MADDKPHDRPNFAGVLRLSLGFFLLFAAFNTAQNLAPTMLQKAGFSSLGFYSLTIIYTVGALAAIPTPLLLQKISARAALPWAASTYAVYILGPALLAAGFGGRVAGAFVVVSAGLCGFGAIVLWIAQGQILAEYAPAHLVDTYVSVFFLAFNAGNMAGPAMVKQLLGAGASEASVLAVLSLTAALAALCLLRLPPASAGAGAGASASGEGPSLAEFRKRLLGPVALLAEDSVAPRILFVSLPMGVAMSAFFSATLPALSLARGSPADGGVKFTAQALVWRGVGMIAATFGYAPLARRGGRGVVLLLVGILSVAAIAAIYLEFSSAAYMMEIPYACLASGLVGLATLLARQAMTATVSSVYKKDAARGNAIMQLANFGGNGVSFLILPHCSALSASKVLLGGLALASFAAGVHAPLSSQTPVSERAKTD
eukprot:TRINITY_DN15615_c0_g1_i1.p1 TRINITY_DN15615_c0_g1~~TRINITY_DN15615_c0_g1_i1.p1  ORF type:complete len:430 (+),score=86.49 TRINITY_DN15615_c0_g1_i1:51-1340(+)